MLKYLIFTLLCIRHDPVHWVKEKGRKRCKRTSFYPEVIIAEPVWLLERTMIGSWEILVLDYAIKLIWFVQAGFRKGRGTRDQIANIWWVIEKAREFQKNFLLYWLCQSLWLCGSQQIMENSLKYGNTRSPYLPPEKPVCGSRSNS